MIELESGIVKIGRSQNPSRRITQLLVGNDRQLALICCFWMDEVDAIIFERRIHRKLQKTNVHARGEVYYLDAETAVAMIKTIIGKRTADVTGIEHFEAGLSAELPKSGQSLRWRRGRRRHPLGPFD